MHKLKTKLLLAFMLIVVLVAVSNLASFFVMRSYMTRYDNMVERVTKANDITIKAKQATDILTKYVTQLPDQAYVDEIQENIASIRDDLKRVQTIVEDDNAKKAINSVSYTMDSFEDAVDKAISSVNDKKVDVALEANDQAKKMYGFIADNIQSFINEELTYDTEQKDKLNRQANTMGIMIIVLILVFIGLSATMGLIFANNIANPIISITRSASEISDGKLNVDIPDIKTKDEVSALVSAFGSMVNSLKQMVTSIKNYSEQLLYLAQQIKDHTEQNENTAEQIALITQEVSKGASDQAQQMQLTSEATGELQNIANNISLTGQKAKEISMKTAAEAEDGNQAIGVLINSMDDLNSVVSFADTEAGQLREQSKQIGDIIEVISHIAKQTNLLALNAAIEAARAGEQGRGFSVVAGEIRQLAERTTRASDNVAQTIKKIQISADNVSQQMSASAARIIESSKLAHNAGGAFSDISTRIDEVDSGIDEIYRQVEHMVDYTGKINSSVHEIAAIAEQTSAGTQQTAAAIEEQTASISEIASSSSTLFELADALKQLTEKFQL
ncbi:MAG: methyl-accepting chemotaxis protein [Clostridiales bacterium]|nr:methyl-accepting chemotaxis protein [Clostridiales bacterium]